MHVFVFTIIIPLQHTPVVQACRLKFIVIVALPFTFLLTNFFFSIIHLYDNLLIFDFFSHYSQICNQVMFGQDAYWVLLGSSPFINLSFWMHLHCQVMYQKLILTTVHIWNWWIYWLMFHFFCVVLLLSFWSILETCTICHFFPLCFHLTSFGINTLIFSRPII